MDKLTDKRVLDRELHRRGRAFEAEIQSAQAELEDLADRAVTSNDDADAMAERLLAEKRVRDKRIERIMSEPPPKPAGFPSPMLEIDE